MPTRRRGFKIGACKPESEDFEIYNQKTNILMSLCMIARRFYTTCLNSKEEVVTCMKHFSDKLRKSHCIIEKEVEAVLEVLKLETRMRSFKSSVHTLEAEDFKVQNLKTKISINFTLLEGDFTSRALNQKKKLMLARSTSQQHFETPIATLRKKLRSFSKR